MGCLALTLALPAAVTILVDHYNDELLQRARHSPLVVGAKGSRIDLVLKTLYFDTEYDDQISAADLDDVDALGYGAAIPMHLRHRVHRFADPQVSLAALRSVPLVGTSVDYFDARELELGRGRPFVFLGDVVVGHDAAETLGVGPGDAVLSEALNAYDPALSFQLKMQVTGVLAPSGGADDSVVFTDVRTAWVIDGIGHGHMEIAAGQAGNLLDRGRSGDGNLVATGKVANYQEITEANRGSFHFHGDRAAYPLTAVLFTPDGDKSSTLARARYAGSEIRDMVPPLAVVEELMDVIFRFKRLLDANFVVVTLTTTVFLALIVVLSVRIRQSEMETLRKIGCGRRTAFWLQTIELGYLLGLSIVVAVLMVAGFTAAAPNLIQLVR